MSTITMINLSMFIWQVGLWLKSRLVISIIIQKFGCSASATWVMKNLNVQGQLITSISVLWLGIAHSVKNQGRQISWKHEEEKPSKISREIFIAEFTCHIAENFQGTSMINSKKRPDGIMALSI